MPKLISLIFILLFSGTLFSQSINIYVEKATGKDITIFHAIYYEKHGKVDTVDEFSYHSLFTLESRPISTELSIMVDQAKKYLKHKSTKDRPGRDRFVRIFIDYDIDMLSEGLGNILKARKWAYTVMSPLEVRRKIRKHLLLRDSDYFVRVTEESFLLTNQYISFISFEEPDSIPVIEFKHSSEREGTLFVNSKELELLMLHLEYDYILHPDVSIMLLKLDEYILSTLNETQFFDKRLQTIIAQIRIIYDRMHLEEIILIPNTDITKYFLAT